MIYFDEIFQKVFSILDDPDLSQKYFYDKAGFQKDMLGFLLVGKNKFTSPTAITDKLIVQDSPIGYVEVIEGTGGNTYALETIPHEHAALTYRIGKELVPGYYDRDNNQVIFSKPILLNETGSVTWFYAGAFSADFSDCLRKDFPIDAIMDKVITILAYATLSAYGDKEVGRVIEVRNILTDHDFKMYSPANSANAKVAWRNQMNKDMDTLVSELNWRILSEPKGGTRFGK